MMGSLSLPRHAWAIVIRQTAIHLSVTVLISVAVSYVILDIFSQGIDATGVTAAIVAPIVLGGPSMFFTAFKNRQLQLAYDRLEASASLDSLTGCLHHGAFVQAVSAALKRSDGASALLVADADHFKAINDTFGHANGDTALKLIVASIRASVEETAIIGRLGGEEFGIFLPDATIDIAERTAEAVRQAVERTRFEAGEQSCGLSVSIGGAVAADRAGFGEMFRLADERLYKVKQSGRNGVDIVMLPLNRVPPQAEPTVLPDLVYRGTRVKRSA